MLNFFELMGIKTGFNVDINQLQHNFRQLQTQYHPDNLRKSETQAFKHLKPEQLSAVINEAYQTLYSPDTRAKHLLSLKDIAISTTDSIRDLGFLDDAMEFRIALDEADITELAHLTTKLEGWLADYASKFDGAYQALSQNSQDSSAASCAIDATQKLQFLVKLEKDVAKKRDELAVGSEGDDDLYV